MDLLVYLPIKHQIGGSRHRLRKEQISSTPRVVLCGNEGSFSSLLRDTLTATEIGTWVNRDTTSNNTKTSVLASRCDVMNSPNCCEFLTWCTVWPTTGFRRDAKNLDNLYAEKNETRQWVWPIHGCPTMASN